MYLESNIGAFLNTAANESLRGNPKQEKSLSSSFNFKLAETTRKQSRFEEYFNNFREIVKDKIDLEDLFVKASMRIQETNASTKFSVRNILGEVYKTIYLPPEDLEEIGAKMLKYYRETFFSLCPGIFRAKYVGKIKEDERIHNVDNKPDASQWDFKLNSLKNFYKVQVVHLEGKVNMVLESIFEILHSNYWTILGMLKQFNRLEDSAFILSFAKNYLGGRSKDYFNTIVERLLEKNIPRFIDTFFSTYMTLSLGFFGMTWGSWHQQIRKLGSDTPDFHLFLNSFRLGLHTPEVRTYCSRMVDSLGKIFLTLKTDGNNAAVMNPLNKLRERVRQRCGISQRVLLSTDALKQVMVALDFRDLANCVGVNVKLVRFFEILISNGRAYLQSKNMDSNNIFLLLLYLQLYGIIIPYCLRICRTCFSDFELHYHYHFMNQHMLDAPFEVACLESNRQSMAMYMFLLDYLNSILPSILYHMVSQNGSDMIDRIMSSYGQHIDSLAEVFDVENKTPCPSPFLDRIELIEVSDFLKFSHILKNFQLFSDSPGRSLFPTTFDFLELYLETLKSPTISQQLDRKIKEFLLDNLERDTRVLVIVSANLCSLFNEKQLSEVAPDFYRFFEPKSFQVDRYAHTLEKVTYFVVQSSLSSANPTEEPINNLPVLISPKRRLWQFLHDRLHLDADNKSIQDRLLDNCTLILLFEMMDQDQFEQNFSQEIDQFVGNLSFLKGKIDRILKFRKIGEVMAADLAWLEHERNKLDKQLKFAEGYYLRSFFYV